jgi:hypothetical protein
LPFALKDLPPTLERIGGRPIYGWEFVDVEFNEAREWSCRVELGLDGLSHVLHLFQGDGPGESLDLWLWFDTLEVRTPGGDLIPLAEFIAGGRRWWDALFAGDERTAGAGIVPLKGTDE